jgi:hypothetical protein
MSTEPAPGSEHASTPAAHPAPHGYPASHPAPHQAASADPKGASCRTILAAAGIALLLALIFWGAILKNPGNWGVRDWGFHLYMNSVVKESLAQHGQLPFWDPYRCGGNVALAHPEFPAFSLMFLLAWLFPTMLGFKLAIILYAALGLLGAWLLGRQMRLSPLAAAVPAIVYTLNSSLFLYLAEGNYWARAVVWLPWLAYFWLKCGESRRYALPAGAFLLLILLDTNIYMFGVALFFLASWAVLDAAIRRRRQYLVALVLVGLAAGLFGAFKVLPMYDFARQFADQRTDPESGYTWKSLTTGLLDPNQDPYGHWFPDKRPFFHHGTYIGWLPLLLGLAGVLLAWKRWFLWLTVGLLALIISFGKNGFINLYAVIKALPLYASFHEATRFLPVAMLALGLFAGYTVDFFLRVKSVKLGEKPLTVSHGVRTGIFLALLGFILLNMHAVNTAVLPKVFIAPPLPLGPPAAEYSQVNSPYGTNPWSDGKLLPQSLYYDVWGHAMVLNLFQNKGTMKGNCHGAVGVLQAQPAFFDDGAANPAYRGEAYLDGMNGTARITEFTNNRIRVTVETATPGLLVLNQNHYGEWRASGGTGLLQKHTTGLMAVPVDSTTREVTFWYSPRLFTAGLLISLLAIIGGILAYRRWDAVAARVKLL